MLSRTVLFVTAMAAAAAVSVAGTTEMEDLLALHESFRVPQKNLRHLQRSGSKKGSKPSKKVVDTAEEEVEEEDTADASDSTEVVVTVEEEVEEEEEDTDDTSDSTEAVELKIGAPNQPFLLVNGATCPDLYRPLTSSWVDCRDAAISLGFSGDTINHVDYKYPWGTGRPQGCFQSTGNNRFHFNTGAGGGFIGNDKILCKALFLLVNGATCPDSYTPLTSSWQDCRDAAVSLGFTGDTINHVDYKYPWGKGRPQGCFQSTGNNRFHFNTGAGGSFIGNDKILCKTPFLLVTGATDMVKKWQ